VGRITSVRGEVLLLCLAQERLEEEGVAAGGVAAGRREVVRHLPAEPALAEHRRGLDAQRFRPQPGGLGAGGQPSQVDRDLLPAADGGEHGQGKAIQAGGQVVEESQRFRVGPVQVVDGEGHGTLVGQIAEQPVQAVQHAERAIAPERGLRGAGRGEQRLRQGRGALEQTVTIRVRGPRDRGLQQLPHAAEGKIALQLAGPRSKTGEARCGGGLAGHPEQARLTEPGRGFDEHDLAPALSRLGQRAAELRKLTLALQKRRRRLDCHSSSPPLGTAEPSYPVSLSPSREATALVTAPAEGWAAGPPGLVAAIASARSQTAWAMRCSGSRAKPSTRTAPAASKERECAHAVRVLDGQRDAAAWASAMTSFRPLVLTYGSSCVVRSWLVGAAPARRWGHPGIARRRSPGPLLGSRSAARWAAPSPRSRRGWPGRRQTPTGWLSRCSAAGGRTSPASRSPSR